MDEKCLEKINEVLLEQASFLITSARGLIVEPQSYGPLRCLDAVSRLIESLEKAGCPYDKEFFNELKKEIDEKSVLVIEDEKKFEEFIIYLTKKIGKKVKDTIL